MNLQTTLARGVAEQAAHNWLGHRKHCPTCDSAIDAPERDQLCRQGAELYVIKRNADAELRRNRALDRLPAPDQPTLF